MPPKKRFVTCEICGDRAKRIDREKRKFMAKFPLDESRCRQWVKFVGKEDLIYVPIEKLHSLKYVCGAHFEIKAFNKKNNRLNKSAVPSINLRADPLPDEKLLEFPCHISSYTDMITMEVYKRTNLNVASTSMTESIAGPSRMEKSTLSNLLLLEHAYCIQKEIILPETTQCKKVKTSHSGTVSLHIFPNPAKNNKPFDMWLNIIGGDILELNDNHIFKYRRVCNVHFEEKYCRNNRISNNAVPTKNLPGRMANVALTDPFQDIATTGLSLPTSHERRPLTAIQTTEASTWKEPVAPWLYSQVEDVQDKMMMSLSLMMRCHLNPIVAYNEKNDRVFGIVTDGQNIQAEYADHIQVFMIRGLIKNYKQPVAYTFAQAATKWPELAKQLQIVVGQLQEAGLIGYDMRSRHE